MLPDNLASSYLSYKEDTSLFTTWLSKAALACGYKIPTKEERCARTGPGHRGSSHNADIKSKTSSRTSDTEPSWTQITNRFLKLSTDDVLDAADDKDDGPEFTVDMSTTYELEDESIEMKMSLMIFYFFEDLHRIQEFLHGVWKKYKSGKLDLVSASLITNSAFEIVHRNEEEILATAPKLFSKKRSYDTIATVIFYANAFSRGQDPKQTMETNEMLRPTPFDDFIYLSTSRTLMKYEFLSQTAPNFPSFPLPSFPLRGAYISCPEVLGTPYMNKKEEEDALLSQLMMDLDLFDLFNKTMKNNGLGHYAPPAEDALSAGLRQLKMEGVISVSLVFASRIFLDLHDILGNKIVTGRRELKATGNRIEKFLEPTGVQSHPGEGESYLWLPKDTTLLKQIIDINYRWTDKSKFEMMKMIFVKQEGCSESNWGKMGNSVPMNAVAEGPVNRPKPMIIEKSSGQAHSQLDAEKVKQASLRGTKFPEKPKLTNMSMTAMRVPNDAIRPDGSIDPAWEEKLMAHARTESGVDDEPCDPEHEENARKLDIRMIKPHQDMDFVFTHNPVYCGTMALRLITATEQAGINHCCYHTVTTLVAYLYAECRRSKLLDSKWPAMEQMIELHLEDMFSDNLPKSASEGYIRFTKLLVISKTKISRYQRSLPYKEPQYATNAVSTATRPFLEHQATFNNAINNLQRLIQTHRELTNNETKHKRRNARRQLTPFQFLSIMQEFIPAEIAKVQFDYISLTIACHRLMKKFRVQIKGRLGIDHPLLQHEDSTEPSYPFIVMNILYEGRNGGENHQLKVVAEVLKDYLAGL
ncbi:hypothetical protein SBOR_7014 [Sclerotinia borealis F-4128]|uniref:DUF6604 domain-containing protein n=1 Tax=Sclerotinia borealis (strain F-4128) TaxID=1432307 RepID=W9C757_SCLBF|nr:hypothetical protein SBOR_7014 [Sclerotinia borealis F-4128]